MKTLYAHGKLLISAEYMVLHGSKALAIPLQYGQSLQKVRLENRRIFSWRANYLNQEWFSAMIDPVNLKILNTSDPIKAAYLQKIIRTCIELVPSFQEELFGREVETILDFSPMWGFGSSSTLTALMAEWVEVNPLDLHFMISEGSGCDVACAIADGPIAYKLRDQGPHYQHVTFSPPFADQLYFAWLGTKQITAEHLVEVAERITPNYELTHQFSSITESMIEAEDLATFQDLMEEHEDTLSSLLKMERISSTRFPGLPGSVKSLGAWGGDFVMIASDTAENELFDYLHTNDIDVIFRYKDLVYNGKDFQ